MAPRPAPRPALSLLPALLLLASCGARLAAAQCDPSGSLAREPDPSSGLCACKNPNIAGAKCERCRENFHDLAAGCLPCDTCYEIVGLGVEHQRRALANLTELVDAIERNPDAIKDESFARRLLELLNRVNGLLRDAESAQGLEQKLLADLDSLLARLKAIRATSEAVERHLSSARPLLGQAATNVSLAEDLLRRIQDEAARAERHVLGEGMSALGRARERADRLGQQSRRMADMAKESRQLADQHEAEAARVRELSLEAANHTELAHELARNAAAAQEANAKNIARLRAQIERMLELLAKTRKMAAEATQEARRSYEEALALYTQVNALQVGRADAARLEQQAGEHLRSAQRLRQEVEEFIARHRQLLDSTQFRLGEMRALLAEAARQQSITDGQLAELDRTLARARAAVRQGERTLKEAQDALDTLRKFDRQVEESRREALEALKRIPAIRDTIRHAEEKTRDAAAKLDTALADATEARDLAQRAFGLANDTSADVRKIRAEAGELKTRISQLRSQAAELGDNLNHTGAAMDQFEATAKTDGEMAALALERANQAALSARNATETAKGLLGLLNPLLKSIDKLEGIDGAKLAQLEEELARLRQKLAESGLAATTDELLAQRDRQRELMAEYKALIDWLVREVANVRAIRDSLPDRCFKRSRLEVPKEEN